MLPWLTEQIVFMAILLYAHYATMANRTDSLYGYFAICPSCYHGYQNR